MQTKTCNQNTYKEQAATEIIRNRQQYKSSVQIKKQTTKNESNIQQNRTNAKRKKYKQN